MPLGIFCAQSTNRSPQLLFSGARPARSLRLSRSRFVGGMVVTSRSTTRGCFHTVPLLGVRRGGKTPAKRATPANASAVARPESLFRVSVHTSFVLTR
jgi:hypothetical protein